MFSETFVQAGAAAPLRREGLGQEEELLEGEGRPGEQEVRGVQRRSGGLEDRLPGPALHLAGVSRARSRWATACGEKLLF